MGKQTLQEAYLAEMLEDVYNIKKEAEATLQKINDMSGLVNQSIITVEEGIKKSSDKAAATLSLKLDAVMQQLSNYQSECLKAIGKFVTDQANILVAEAEKTRTANVELASKEMEHAKQHSLKEIALLINKINGNKLESKLLIFAIIFSICSSLITGSVTYLIVKNNVAASYQPAENAITTTKQKRDKS